MPYPLHKLIDDRPFCAAEWRDDLDSEDHARREPGDHSRDVSRRARRAAWSLLADRLPLDSDLPF